MFSPHTRPPDFISEFSSEGPNGLAGSHNHMFARTLPPPEGRFRGKVSTRAKGFGLECSCCSKSMGLQMPEVHFLLKNCISFLKITG